MKNILLTALVAATLISCDKREDIYNSTMSTAEVRVNDGNSYGHTAMLICNGEITKLESFEVDFAIPYVVNIARIPFIDSINDDFEFFTIIDGVKYKGTEAIHEEIGKQANGQVVSVTNEMLDGEFQQALLYIPSHAVNRAQFFVKKGDQQIELLTTELY